MNFLKKLTKCLADVLMLFILIGSVGNVWFLAHSDQVVPINSNDLGSVQITVRDLYQPFSRSNYILLSNEYPTKFLFNTLPPTSEDMKSLIKIGHKANVEIKKESIGKLKDIGLVLVYELTLDDGTIVFDTRQTIPQHRSMTSFDLGNAFFYGMIAVPVLYFLMRIFFCLNKSKRFLVETKKLSWTLPKRAAICLLYSLGFFGIQSKSLMTLCLTLTFPFLPIAYMAGGLSASIFGNSSVGYAIGAWIAVFVQSYLLVSILSKAIHQVVLAIESNSVNLASCSNSGVGGKLKAPYSIQEIKMTEANQQIFSIQPLGKWGGVCYVNKRTFLFCRTLRIISYFLVVSMFAVKYIFLDYAQQYLALPAYSSVYILALICLICEISRFGLIYIFRIRGNLSDSVRLSESPVADKSVLSIIYFLFNLCLSAIFFGWAIFLLIALLSDIFIRKQFHMILLAGFVVFAGLAGISLRPIIKAKESSKRLSN